VHRKADRRLAIKCARGFLDDNEIDVPVDPFAIALKLEIQLEPIDNSKIDFSGCLLREGGSWAILYRDDISSLPFKRFTVAHELGHFEMAHHHDALFASREMHISQSNFTSHLWHEIEADTFAAEIMMPEHAFADAIRGCSIGFDAIESLAERFGTSLTSTAIRYAALSPDPVAIVVSEGGRVRYCFGSPRMNQIRSDYIEPGTPLPPASLTRRCSKTLAPGEVKRGASYLSAWFDNATTDLEFNEDVIDLGRYGKTLTVLHGVEVPDEGSSRVAADDEDDDDDGINPDGKRYRW
jgi:hypothetical protein